MEQTVLFADDEVLVGRAVMDPGEISLPHIHSDQSETIVMLRGRVCVQFLDENREIACTVAPQSARHPIVQASPVIEAGSLHTVASVGPEAAEFVVIMRRVTEANECAF